MFPMISSLNEFAYARGLVDKELERERSSREMLPRAIHVGAMLEVPALVFQLRPLLKVADFVSIGTNDLLQFLFASDRGNSHVSNRYDALSPIFLGMLRNVVQQCERAGVPIAVCGEMAAGPLDAMALMGIGFRSLSVSPPAVGPIKAAIRSLDLGPLEHYVLSLLETQTDTVRERLKLYARDHGIVM